MSDLLRKERAGDGFAPVSLDPEKTAAAIEKVSDRPEERDSGAAAVAGSCMKQEVLLELHCLCRICGRRWVIAKELVWHRELSCCGHVRVREVPGQLLFSDNLGAWTRRGSN
jgi:hypothetical protein